MCVALNAVATLTVDLNDVQRHWPCTPFIAVADVDPSSLSAYLKVLRIAGSAANVGFSVRATKDQNNPGNFTTVGSTLNSVSDVLQTLNVSGTTSGNLFFQLAITGTSNTPGQAEVTAWIQG